MKAMILAGGPGTRLRSAVFDRPKSMALIAGKPFLEHQIRLLREKNIVDIILCVFYMANKIKSYFGDGKRFGVSITYSEEETPLGTAGAIKKAERYINDTFIVLNGDSYSDIDFKNFLEFHRLNNSKFTISLTTTTNSLNYGSVILEGNKIIKFLEKQINGENLVSSGIYIFEPEIFNYIPADKHISLEKQIFPELAEKGLVHGYKYEGYFIDIGLPETYKQFKRDILSSLTLKDTNTIRDSMKKNEKTGMNVVLVVDKNDRLIGIVTEKDIKNFLLNGGNLDEELWKIVNKNFVTSGFKTEKERTAKIFESGMEYMPVLDESGRVKDMQFIEEKIESETFPVIRGLAPLRISLAGGGTDLAYFFEKYSGAVINATIDKYCYATIVKRADRNIMINSDLTSDILVESMDNLKYNGKFDLFKAIINIMKPNFGFDLYVHNDIPPGRGLGSSASMAVLLVMLLSQLKGEVYDDQKIAEVAYKAEREELKIKGGWQDQYAAVTGGFNFIEFSKDKTIIHPLRLKNRIVDELNSHFILCYVGKSHNSGEIHKSQEGSFIEKEEERILNLNKLKKITIEIKDALLTNKIENIGRLLNEAWKNKKMLDKNISSLHIDGLYETGLKNGAYGGKLLGAGGGGYLLFFYQPKKRNVLIKALEEKGGMITNFKFEFGGTKTWTANEF